MNKCILILGCMTCLFTIVSIPTTANAQPLVTDGLSVYYNFDSVDEDGIWLDGSGNNLHGLTTFGQDGFSTDANDDGLDDIRLDTEDFIRGTGSVWFDTDPEVQEDYIAVCDPNFQPDHNAGCDEPEELRPDYVPDDGFTVAAWVKVEDVGADHSVWQSRAFGGGFIHTQVQSDGNIRMRLRGAANKDNIVQFNEPPDGEPVPFDDWFHFAGTYEKGDDPEVPGEWAVYINGQDVAGGEANGDFAGTEFEVLGDWGSGAFVGLVPDFARQLVGRMDEFYLFNRALTDLEVMSLANPVEPVTGDFNDDGLVDVQDANLLTAASASGGNEAAFDLTGDGVVNADDVSNWAKGPANTWIGDANVDGEFNSADFVAIFQAGEFEDAVAGNSVWSTGDWNGDGDFTSSDLVTAFQDGGFELGPRPAVAAVPEPSSILLLLMAAPLLLRRKLAR